MAIVSAGEPIGPALQRAGYVCFQPFRFGKWMAISLAAALTLLGEGGGGFFFNFPSSAPPGGPSPEEVLNWLDEHLVWILVIGTALALVACAIYLLVRWLNSRGQFMFYDHIVGNDARVKASWHEFREQGNSLFRLRLVWDLVWFNAFLLILIVTVLILWPDVQNAILTERYEWTVHTTGAIAFGASCAVICSLALWLASCVIFYLGVPVMYVRRLKAWPSVKIAWNELFRPHMGTCSLYFLLMVVVHLIQGVWSGLAALLLVVVTCCTGYCLLIIPGINIYVMALVSLPVMVFERSYMLHFLAQFGPQYQVAWQYSPVSGFPVILNESQPPEGPADYNGPTPTGDA